MKVIALSRKARPYIPKDFREETSPPKFFLRSMTRLEYLEFHINNPPETDITKAGDILRRLQGTLKGLEGDEKDKKDEKAIQELSPQDMADFVEASRLTTIGRRDRLRRNIMALKTHLDGWENVPVEVDGKNELLEFSEENIECLDETLIAELAAEIMGEISGPDTGNSEEPSSALNGTENSQTAEKDGTAETVEKPISLMNETVNP